MSMEYVSLYETKEDQGIFSSYERVTLPFAIKLE